MRITQLWTDQPIPVGPISSATAKSASQPAVEPIFALCFHPEGSPLLVASGCQLLVYQASSGDLVTTLRAHRDTIYAVDYSSDGRRFATGGADKTVILWNAKFEALVKFTLSDGIQCLAYNPVSNQLASCTATEMGLWSAEQNHLTRFKVPARILICSWTSDGQHLALGMINGLVSIRTRLGDEVTRLDRQAPVWALQWNPSPTAADSEDLLVADGSRRLAFFHHSGRSTDKERTLDYDPYFLSIASGGPYFVMGGSDGRVTLYTMDGYRIQVVGEQANGWIWSCRFRPKHQCIAFGTQDGQVIVNQITFNTVHGLYMEKYAFRDNLTDIIIQQLSTDQRARIKCRDYVRKIAIYKNRLAAQLSDRIVIYEHLTDPDNDLYYKMTDKIFRKFDCNLLVVMSQNILLCIERRLQLLSFDGERQREWCFDAFIRYIKVIGGPGGREGLLVGLKNGAVSLLFVHAPFPIPVVKLDCAVRCLDLSQFRRKIAIVDEHSTLHVYDMKTKEPIFTESGVNSVAWNTVHEEMLCYSGNNTLYIKAAMFPPFPRKTNGFVVGYQGSKIFCLNSSNMVCVDVPQSEAMDQYLGIGDFKDAYSVACMGVGDSDWRRLAVAAMNALDLGTARKSFIRLRDVRQLSLVQQLEEEKSLRVGQDQLLRADMLAFQSNFHEAARLYREVGHAQRAVDMYTEMQMWEFATKTANETVGPTDVQTILMKKAKNEQEKNNLEAAADTYVQVGNYMEAVDILGQKKWFDRMLGLVRSLRPSETESLLRCAELFKKHERFDYAIETYKKLGHMKELVAMYVELGRWEEAFKLGAVYEDQMEAVYLPYADHLIMKEEYLEAQQYFRRAGRMDMAMDLMNQLLQNAVAEHRFLDASYFCFLVARECWTLIPTKSGQSKALQGTADSQKYSDLHDRYQQMADQYNAYHSVYRYVEEPFSLDMPESIFHRGRYLMHQALREPFHHLASGIRLSVILVALARLSIQFEAYKFAQVVHDRLLSSCRVDARFRETIESSALLLLTKPHDDPESLCPTCWSCGSVNPLWVPLVPGHNFQSGGGRLRCAHCGQPFVLSGSTFESLPVQQFTAESGIGDEEALTLLKQDVSSNQVADQPAFDRFQLDDLEQSVQRALLLSDSKTPENQLGPPLPVMSRAQLAAMDFTQVVILPSDRTGIPTRYYKIMMGSSSVTACMNCQRLFDTEEWEYLILRSGCCPFCRTPVDRESVGE